MVERRTTCAFCNAELPLKGIGERGRPRVYCEGKVCTVARTAQKNAKAPDRAYYPGPEPVSASVILPGMSPAAVAWREARAARLRGVAAYERALASSKRARGIII